jgi:hypothetical protein
MAKPSNIPGLPGWNWPAKAWAAYWLLVAVLGILASCQEAFWHFRAEGWLGKHLTVLPFTVALLAFGGAIFWVPWLIDRRRTKAVATLTNDLDMQFTAQPPRKQLAAFSKLALFRVGAESSLRNLVIGRFGGADVLLVDYYCKVGPRARSGWPKSHRAYRCKTTVLILPNAAADLPDLMVTPRVGLTTEASVINLMLTGYADLEIGKQPAHPFASHYWVGGRDGEAIAELFTPEVMDFFVEHKNWNVEVLDHHVTVYRIDRLVRPKECTKRLANALLILQTLARPSAA